MPSCRAFYLPEGGLSDHCPAKFTMQNQFHRTKSTIQYCNARSLHPKFTEKVQAIWNVQLEGYKIWQVVRRLNLLKRGLKELNSQHYRNIVSEPEEDKEASILAQKKLQSDPMNA